MQMVDDVRERLSSSRHQSLIRRFVSSVRSDAFTGVVNADATWRNDGLKIITLSTLTSEQKIVLLATSIAPGETTESYQRLSTRSRSASRQTRRRLRTPVQTQRLDERDGLVILVCVGLDIRIVLADNGET
jgi:hypothetical protein